MRGGKKAALSTPSSLAGSGTDDYIVGSWNNDRLDGGDGNDTLNGWAGADTLYGGSGADTFVIRSWDHSADAQGSRDLIGDFEAHDKIDLHYLFNAVNPDANGFYELVPLTMADVSVETLSEGHYRVHITTDFGDPVYHVGIDVVGVMPTEANFVF